MSDDDQEVVLTPMTSSQPGGHVIRVERMTRSELDTAHVQHIAGGPYKGIIINKASQQDKPSPETSDSIRRFTAYVADQKRTSTSGTDTSEFSRERRALCFWFEDMAKVNSSVIEALTDRYMKELLKPENFPKDYISFVKRVLTLARQYSSIQKLELSIAPMKAGEEDDDVVFRKMATLQRQEATTKTPAGISQEDYHRLADGTLVDSYGNIVHEDTTKMALESIY